MNFFLVKTEPDCFSIDRMAKEKTSMWDGVRNFQARNHLRSMQKGDQVFIYHTGKEKSVVGIATVEKTAYPDPTDKTGIFDCVDLKFVIKFKKVVPLALIKSLPEFDGMPLVKYSRLSVMPISPEHFALICKLAEYR